MPEEKTDQATKADTQTEETKTEQVVKKEQSEKKTEEYKLPEKDFFKPENIDGFIDHLALSEKEEQAKEKEPEGKKEAPKEEKKTEEVKKTEKVEKPYKVLKVDGKDVPVKTKEEFDKLAQQGADYTKKTQALADERKAFEQRKGEISATEERLTKLGEPMQKLLKLAEDGKLDLETLKSKESEINLEDLDEEVREPLQKVLDKNKELEEKVAAIDEKSKVAEEKIQESNFERAKVEMENLVTASREEHPFEEVKNEEERNISQDLFVGLVSSKVNTDRIQKQRDSSFQPRTMEQVFKESAKDLNFLESHYKNKYSSSDGGETLTKEQLAEKNPELFKEIGQDAVTKHLEGDEPSPPIAKSTTQEARTEKVKKEFKSLDDAIEQGLDDPAIAEGLKEVT